jgi:hypothetical protein
MRNRGSSRRPGIACAALVLAVVGSATAAHAGAHSWRVSEVFSNADGSIWFVELWEYNGGMSEPGIAGANIVSINTTNFIDIANNVAGNTANRFVLFGNSAFAALPGAPPLNQEVPGNAFFSFAAGERLRYTFSGMSFDLVLPAGGLPTDGINSFQLGVGVAPNTPTNYAGTSGSVDASGGGGSGDVPLTMEKLAGSLLELSWGLSCEAGDSVVGIYRGTLASLRSGAYDHAALVCDEPGTSTTVTDSGQDEYYLVVPAGTSTEGSYGRSEIDGVETERPQGAAACASQNISCHP